MLLLHFVILYTCHTSMKNITYARLNCSVIVLFIFFLDQITKYLVVKYLIFSESIKALPFLNISLAYNKGIAFSMLADSADTILQIIVAIDILIVLFLIYWIRKLSLQDGILMYAFSLIIGGAIGNIGDKIHLGYVVDFIDFHIHGWHFATFNIADSAICIGTIVYIIDSLIKYRAKKI